MLQGYAVHRWATNLVQPSVLRQLPNPWLDLVDLSIDEPEYLVQIKLVLSAESLFKAVLAELFQRQFSPAHPLSSEAKNLDSVGFFVSSNGTARLMMYPKQCFLNLVQEQATDQDQRLRRIGMLHDELLDRGAWPQEIEQAFLPSVRRLKPTTNLTSFTHLVAAVFRRLPHSHRLHLDPTLGPHLLRGLLMKIWRDEGEGDDSAEAKRIVWAEVIFDVLSGEVYLKPDGKERHFTALTPFDSVHFAQARDQSTTDLMTLTDPPNRVGPLHFARCSASSPLLAPCLPTISSLRPTLGPIRHLAALRGS